MIPATEVFPTIEQTTLNRHLILKSLWNPNLDLLGFTVKIKAGSLYQKKNLAAAATIQLLPEGTHRYNSAQIAEQIDFYGGHTEISAEKDFVSLTIYVAKINFQAILPLIFEILTEPSFAEEETARFKEKKKKQLGLNLEKISYLAKASFLTALYPNHPYGETLNIEMIEALTAADLKAHHATFYTAENMRFFLFGNYDAADISTVKNIFSGIPSGTPAQSLYLKPEFFTGPKFLEQSKPGALQAALRVGTKIPNIIHEDYPVLMIYNTLLGGYFGSRLMQNIREEKGLTYSIYSALVSLQDSGYFYIDTEIAPHAVELALTEISKEILNLQTHQISEDECLKLRNYLSGQALRQIDGTYAVFKKLTFYDDYGLDFEVEKKYFDVIRTFMSKDIMETARKYTALESVKVVIKP